jgi:hypothetical protein
MKDFRAPKDALLDKLCKLNEDGTYESKYKKNKRFGITIQTLSGGRLILAKAGNVIIKMKSF